jgi:hypothetical protein
MNVTFFEGGRWINSGQISCLPREMIRLGLELMLAINPPETVVAEADEGVDRASYTIPWLKALSLWLSVPEGMVVLQKPTEWLRASPGSQAIYPAYWEFAPRYQGGLLLQVLDGRGIKAHYAETSCHLHQETTERFYPVRGNLEIQTGEHSWRPIGWRDEIPVDVRHQLRVARGDVAITIIHMDGPHPLLKGHRINLTDHHYRSW